MEEEEEEEEEGQRHRRCCRCRMGEGGQHRNRFCRCRCLAPATPSTCSGSTRSADALGGGGREKQGTVVRDLHSVFLCVGGRGHLTFVSIRKKVVETSQPKAAVVGRRGAPKEKKNR
jgi:hypothetical protein